MADIDNNKRVRPMDYKSLAQSNRDAATIRKPKEQLSNITQSALEHTPEGAAQAARAISSKSSTPATITPRETTDDTPKTYQDLIDMYSQMRKKETDRYDQESKLAERQANNRRAIMSIGDAARAVANLGATTQYAPNAYDHSDNMSDKARERYEKAKAAMDKTHANNLAYIEKLRSGATSDYKNKNDERRIEIAEREQDRLEAQFYVSQKESEWKHQMAKEEFEYKKAKDELDRQLEEKKISISQYDAATRRLDEITDARKAQGYTDNTIKTYDPKTGRQIGQTTTRTLNDQKQHKVIPLLGR